MGTDLVRKPRRLIEPQLSRQQARTVQQRPLSRSWQNKAGDLDDLVELRLGPASQRAGPGFPQSLRLLHTSSVQPISSAWQIWLPLVVVPISALVLVSAFRSRESSAPLSRLATAFTVLVWLRLAGEAAFGDQRPAFERQWKGVAALLLAMAGAVHLWKRYCRRDRDSLERVRAPQKQPAPAASAAQSTPHGSLAVLVTMPALGEDVIEGTVTRWLKQVGDRVEAGEPLVEVSTDKVDIEIPAQASGALHEVRIAAGRTAPVGATIAVIEP